MKQEGVFSLCDMTSVSLHTHIPSERFLPLPLPPVRPEKRLRKCA